MTPAARLPRPVRAGAECQGELDLLVCEASGRLALAAREMGERRLRAPGEVTRAGDLRSCQRQADGQEVLESFRDPPLCDAQPAAGDAKNGSRDRPAFCFRVERRERLLCRVELALIGERHNEHTGVQDAVQGWCRELGRGKRRPCVSLRGDQIAAPGASQPR